MSDTMLLGVLRMPMDNPDPVRLRQFVSRARQAADRIEADAREIARLQKDAERLQKDHSAQPLEMVLNRLSRDMIVAANAIEAYGNIVNSTELRGAALQVREWADAVKSEREGEP